VRPQVEQLIAREPHIARGRGVHIDEFHRLAIDKEDTVVRHIERAAKPQQLFFGALGFDDHAIAIC
jgi:hypothetical protein